MYSTLIAKTLEFNTPSKELLVETALDLVGSRSLLYINGQPEVGQSPNGFDCSGFVRYALQQSGFFIPDFIGMDNVRRPIRHANEFWDSYGATVHTQHERGDLIFFSRHGLFPTHVGIVRDEETFIHAPGKPDTKVIVEEIVNETVPEVQNRGRILFKSNPIGYKSPTITRSTPTYRYHQELAE